MQQEGALQPVIGLLSSRCTESQREAALLLGQFATATVTGNEDYKVPKTTCHLMILSNSSSRRLLCRPACDHSGCRTLLGMVHEVAEMPDPS